MGNAAKKVERPQNLESRRLITPEFRVSYPHVFKPTQYKGKGDARYSITMLFKKTQDISALKLAMKHAKIDFFGPKEEWPDDLYNPIIDGDAPKYASRQGYKGHYAIKASCREDQKPGVVDANNEPIIDVSEFYPGCYARAQIFAFAWGDGDKAGVSFILDHVQKTRDGKSLSGKKTAQEVFGAPISGDTSDDEDEEESGEDDDYT